MIGDIFVGALLVISGCINLLAIGAFWVTPSLRTTANRFVINLLLVNFISCLILSPFAFNVGENSPTSRVASLVQFKDSNLTTDVTKLDNIVLVNSTSVGCTNHTRECLEWSIRIVESLRVNNKSVNDERNDDNSATRLENDLLKKYQSWSLDLVVALSVLSVLLVVMDTFVAVTDPLRYHSRISDLKAWLLIAFCWMFGVSFGVASALRTGNGGEIFLSSHFEKYDDSNIYNTMFLFTYFLSIIITPCLLVSLMYWRIYSEARESGQRMRQNGSSPLLQSALNLVATANTQPQQSTILTNPQCLLLVTSSPQTNKHQYSPLNKQATADNGCFFHQTSHANGGLTMKIDKQDYYSGNNNNITQQINLNNNNHLSYGNNGAFHDTNTFLLSSPPHELMPMLSTIDETTSTAPKSQQHQNILLTLTTACDPTIKRNHSAKHLFTEAALYDEVKHRELRQVQSTPNLRKLTESSSELMNHHQEQTLELPSIQASPKALRYMNSLRHRLSNASSLFKYREEGRAARISILGEHHLVLTILKYNFDAIVVKREYEEIFAFISIV